MLQAGQQFDAGTPYGTMSLQYCGAFTVQCWLSFICKWICYCWMKVGQQLRISTLSALLSCRRHHNLLRNTEVHENSLMDVSWCILSPTFVTQLHCNAGQYYCSAEKDVRMLHTVPAHRALCCEVYPSQTDRGNVISVVVQNAGSTKSATIAIADQSICGAMLSSTVIEEPHNSRRRLRRIH